MSRRTKGEGTIRKRSDGRWEGRYVNCIGETKSIYGQTKSDVRKKLQEITYTKNTNIFNDIRGDIALDIWFEHYIEIKKQMIKERSIYQIQMAYGKHISPVLGNIIVCKISPNDVVNLIDSLEKKNLSPVSINNILTHARAMFKFAAEEGVIAKSPFIYVKRTKKPKTSRRNLTPVEVEHLLEVSRSLDYVLYIMLITMLQTGIRAGELCALKWNDFDRNFGSIRIDESLTDARFETTTKTQCSERIVPLTTFLQNEYSEYYKFLQPEAGDYVFINRVGRPFKTSNIDKKFRYLRNCVKEIYPSDNIENVTPHYLRHTFTTIGLNAGVSIKNMQMLLGHADTRTLLETYTHIDFEDKKSSIDAIEKSGIIQQISINQSITKNSEQKLINKWSTVTRFKGTDNYNQYLKDKVV